MHTAHCTFYFQHSIQMNVIVMTWNIFLLLVKRGIKMVFHSLNVKFILYVKQTSAFIMLKF